MFLLVVAAVMSWSFFGNDPNDDPVAGAEAIQGLCAATEAAAEGRDDEVSALFADRAHQQLHDLAAAVAKRDRAMAGRLLEVKQEVEADLEDGRRPRFGPLVAAAREAAAILGPSPGDCARTGAGS